MNPVSTSIVWQPSGDYLNCRVVDFMRLHGIKNWQELIKKSTTDIEWFWNAFSDFAGVQWHKKYKQLLDQSNGIASTNWFIEGELNIAYNCLDWQLEKGRKAGARESVGAEQPSLIWENEEGANRTLSYGELNQLAGKVAALLDQLGVEAGDAVGIYMPMVPEVVAVLFGCFKIGAVVVPIFSGFGAQALAARLEDSQAKVLFTADGGKRNGKLIEIKKDVDEIVQDLPDLKKVVVLKYCQNKIQWTNKDIWWHEAVDQLEPIPTCNKLKAEDPSMYLYTSGTTGKPKGTVHTHAGALFQIAKELGLNFDTQAKDVFFWLTDIGWMMGPWEMIGTLFWGATMVIYEGSPTYPTADRLWQIVEKYKVTTLGISPTAIRVLKTAEDVGPENYNLKSLKFLGSTGEPWDTESYMWFFDNVGGGRCPIINISGGTEIIGCLLIPLPLMPLQACSLGGPGLAMDVDVFDDSGKSLTDSIGHLVCKKPAPSMTKGFLKDWDRYYQTYFSQFSGVWYHGDWAKVDSTGEWFLFGRSDDTIKVAGKRVGPAEVESVLIEFPNITEAAVIGVPHEIKGEAIVCFVVLLPNVTKSDALAEQIRKSVAEKLGGMFRPEKIYFVSALPKTRSGKIVRGAIKRKYLGEQSGDLSSIENLCVLEEIETIVNTIG